MNIKYKVLFADDEYWTREKMARIIPWEKYSLEFLKPAADGEEVLERLEKERPDILITDINMPYLNGVDLLKKVQKDYPELITFVISGYDDFEYVRDSFLSGSIHYLVKPVGKIDLINALSKALELISTRQSRREEEQQRQQELLRASSFIQDREFSQLLDLKSAPPAASFVINSHMEFVGGTLILVKIHQLQEFMQLYGHDMNMLSFSIKKRMQEVCGKPKLLFFNHIYRSSEFLIAGELSAPETEKLAEDLIKDFRNVTKSPVTVVASSHCYSMGNLAEAYVQDVSNLMQRPFGQKYIFIQAAEKNDSEAGKIINRLKETQMKELQGYIRLQRPEKVKKYLYENIGLVRCEKEGWTYLEVRQTVRRFLNLLFEENMQKTETAKILENQSMLEMADKAVDSMDLNQINEILNEVIQSFVGKSQQVASDSIKSGIKQAVLYVQEHFEENLSLSSLSAQFHVESSYFSRMFRKETGENLMLFICRKRMEKAVEYMKNTDRNLTEIAFMVGYDDYTYFNKVFKKMMGISPREYRNQLEEQGI